MNAVSPCIGVCQVDEARVCEGCFRSLDEIAKWSRASEEERRSILRSADTRGRSSSSLTDLSHDVDE